MIGERMGKRGNSEKNWKHGNRRAERTIEKKLHTTRKGKKKPDYCIIYIFGKRCAAPVFFRLKKKKIIKKRGNW